jgi:hypothetical protein
LVGVVLAAVVAGCSGDSSNPSDPVTPTTNDEVSLTSAKLSGGGWSPTVAAAAAASSNGDKVSVCHSGNGKHFTQISVSTQGARAHLGDPSSGKGGHENDYRISFNTPCPPPATPGNVQVCKVAGPGVAVGTNFTFALKSDEGTSSVIVAAGAGPAGTCASAGDFRIGTLLEVTEAAQTGVNTTAIVVSPASAQQGTSDLPNRRATVIVGTGTTSLTFTNQGPTGTLVICKVGGTGVTAGTNFTFTAGALTSTVAAGAAPNGTCGTALTLPVGAVTVTESAVAGTSVSAMTGTPSAPTNINLAARSATAAIVLGQETRITFTNVSP